MKDLGIKTEKILEKDSGEFIDPSFFHIEFSINGKVFKKAVDGLLLFEEEQDDELSDVALDQALVDCSYYRFTFLAAGAEIEQKKAQIKREFATWYAEVGKLARWSIVEARQVEKTEKAVPASWFGSITKQEVEEAILLHPEHSVKYAEYDDQIAEMDKMKKVLFGLRDILHDRGGHLQSIGRRRLENRKMSFGVSQT